MKRPGPFEWYEHAAKKPPPEHGIRIKKAGQTWWGERWLEALEHVLRGDSGRLARGRTYARAGRTHDLVVNAGKVSAAVTGTRSTPYQITIELSALSASAWDKAILGMAQKAQFLAELLAGQMPKEIDAVFRDAGVSLFPKQRAELKTSCTCPDWGDPCKHVAATHYVLGDALDRDPFLLFELRGKTKEQVLAALRIARSGVPGAANTPLVALAADTNAAPVSGSDEIPTVQLGPLKAADYDKPRAALPALHFGFDEPVVHGAVLRQLGAPSTWQGEASPADVLAPLIRAAADAARRIALAEPSAPVESPPEVAKRARKPSQRKSRRLK